MMKCANYCTVTFATYLHVALLHSLHILYSLTVEKHWNGRT